MSDNVFKSYSRYYDLLYKEKDYLAEVDYIHQILKNNNIFNGELLEFGSGTGKHGCILASRDYKIHGIELSSDMIAVSEKASGFTCQQGDISKIRMNKFYDAVLSLFHVISYQVTNFQLLEVFSNANRHLKPGGIFVFDFWYSPAVNSQIPETRIRRFKNDEVEITRIGEPSIYCNDNRVDVNYTIFEKELLTGEVFTVQECHPMRHFSLPEIDLISKFLGFERVSAEEFLTGNTPNENSWGVCVVLKKV